MRILTLPLLLTCILFTGMCSNQKEMDGNNSQMTGEQELQIDTISQETMGQPVYLRETLNLVIRDEDALQALWGTTEPVTGETEFPSVDFSTEMVIVAAMGERGSSGYIISIDKVVEDEDGIQVYITETSPADDCINLTVMTAPHHIVKIPQSDKEVTFNINREINPCS